MAKDIVLWPFGAADNKTPDLSEPVVIENRLTILDLDQLSANATLDLDISPEVPAGSFLVVIVPAAGTQTLTFGDGVEAPVITGVAGKTKVQQFIFTGVSFVATGTEVQID